MYEIEFSLIIVHRCSAQLLVIFDGIALMKAADSCLLTSENSAYFSFEIVYSAVILEIVTACPLEWLERENCNDRDIFLKFGSKTIDFLADFLIVGGIIEPNQSVHGNQSMCLKEEIIFDAFLPKVGCLLRVFAPSKVFAVLFDTLVNTQFHM